MGWFCSKTHGCCWAIHRWDISQRFLVCGKKCNQGQSENVCSAGSDKGKFDVLPCVAHLLYLSSCVFVDRCVVDVKILLKVVRF